MNAKDLEIFNRMPFYFWVKDDHARYLWVNDALSKMAEQDMIGKTDCELAWTKDAEALLDDDKQVFATGKPVFLHEHIAKPHDAPLSVCKFIGDFEGKRCAFGVSFVIG